MDDLIKESNGDITIEKRKLTLFILANNTMPIEELETADFGRN